MPKKIKPSQWDDKRAAKEYGYAHGYYGLSGGWIYRQGAKEVIRYTREVNLDGSRITNFRTSWFNGKPMCQGWLEFYRLYSRSIRQWVNNLENDDATS